MVAYAEQVRAQYLVVCHRSYTYLKHNVLGTAGCCEHYCV
jgi:hypothetical protein